MQVLPTQGLRLNRRHPDAVGCYFAMPVMERGGEVVRDLAWSGSKGLGQPVWSGTRSYVNIRHGRALSVSSGNTVGTAGSGQPWATDWSVCLTVMPTAFIAAKGGLIRSGGFAIAHTASAGTVEIHQDNVAVRATSAQVLVVNQPTVLGVRWRGSDNAYAFFFNGIKESGVGGGTVTSAATPTSIFAAFNAATITGAIRDVRIWNRFMPDVTFERYYRDPLSFYVVRPPAFKGALSSSALFGRMFFPFLHPALQS